jgi:hypothetical protein
MDGAQKLFRFAGAGEKFADRTMTGASVAARAKFNGLDAEAAKVIECRLQFPGAKNDSEDSDFHVVARLAKSVGGTLIRRQPLTDPP